MPTEAYVIVDTDGSAEFDGRENKINGKIAQAEAQDSLVFYVLPERAEMHPNIDEAEVASILRYAPDEDPYDHSQLDEQITSRGVDEVTFFGFGDNVVDMAQRDNGRGTGRSASVDENATVKRKI